MFQSVGGTNGAGGSSSAGATRRIDTIAESVKVKVLFQEGQGLGLPVYHQDQHQQKMADTFSASPSSSRSGNANTTPQRGQPVAAAAAAAAAGSSDDFYLTIRKQPQAFAFPDEVFEFEFGLDGKPSATSSPPSDVEIGVSLKSIKGAVKGEEPTLVLLEAPRVSPSRKTGKVRCKILYEHMARNRGCSMNIMLQTKQDRGITPVTTSIVQLVSAKIRVTPSQDWSSVWFKDEGGRDKCMEAKVEVFDCNDHLVKESIPLRLTLCYASTEPIAVSNQEILRKLGAENKLMVDSQTGMAKIRFRIEDVSKNHQRQNFLVKVAADRPDIRDIAPGLTPSVSVRSKRNKRQRTGSISGSMGGRLSAGGLPDRANNQPSPSGDNRIAATFAESMMMEGADGNRMREAVHGILRWADEVVNGMYYIQWRVVGYASNADGSIDYNRPYHNMQNPNALVDRVLGMYNESTREQLSLLQQVVDQQPHQQHPLAAVAAIAATAAAPPPDSMTRGDTPYRSMGQGPPQLGMSPDIGAMPGMPPPDQQPNFYPGMPPRRLDEPYHMMGLGPSGMVGGAFHDFPMQQQQPLHPPPQQQPLQQQQQQQHQPPPPHQQRMSEQQTPPQHQQHQQQHPLPPQHQQQQQHHQQQHPPQHPSYFLPPISQHRQGKAPPLPGAMMRPPGQAKVASAIDIESEVEYVLAKQYKSVRTGERLGFPAYSIEHEILGFYRESTTKVGVGQFVPVTEQDFGPHEIQQAKKILQGAIAEKSDAVHALKEWGSISSLIDHCLVYDFSKDIGDNNSSNSGS